MTKRIRILIKESDRKRAIKRLYEGQLLEEGLWSKAKHLLGKMGSLEKGGKFFGRGKQAEKAKEYIDKILDKESRQFIKKLDTEIKQEYSEFPNMEDKFEFQNVAASILAVYWSVVAAAGKCGEQVNCGAGAKNLSAKDQGFLPVAAANAIIKDLETYAKYVVDYKLSDVYKHFNENNQNKPSPIYNLSENEVSRMDELFGFGSKDKMDRAIAADNDASPPPDAPPEQDTEREDLFGKDKKTAAMKGLESNTLPLVLSLLGSGFTAAHFAAIAFLPSPSGITRYTFSTVTDHVKEQAGTAAALEGNAKGYLHMFAEASNSPVAKTGAQFTAQVDAIASQTGQTAEAVLKTAGQLTPNPSAGASMGQQMYGFFSSNGSTPMGAVVNSTAPSGEFISHVTSSDPGFAQSITGGASGAGTFKGGMTSILGLKKGVVTIAAREVVKAISRVAVTSGTGATGVTAVTAAIGSGALLSIGIALGSAAAAIKLVRWKGKKSSRAKILQDIINQINPLSDADPDQDDEAPDDDTSPGDDPGPIVGPGGEEPQPGDEPEPEPEKPLDPGQDGEDGPIEPPAEDPEQDDKDKGEEKMKALHLVRMDDDGLKFYRGRKTSEKGREQERDMMKTAQDNRITGRTSDPSTDSLRNYFGKMFAKSNQVKDLTMPQLAKLLKGRNNKRDLEAYFTVDASVMTDMYGVLIRNKLARAKYKKDDKGNRKMDIPQKVRVAVQKTVNSVMGRFLKLFSANPNSAKKPTSNQVEAVLIKSFKAAGFDVEGDAEISRQLLDVLAEYGLIREPKRKRKRKKKAGQTPSTPKRGEENPDPDMFDANMFENTEILKRWKKLAGIIKG